MNNNGLWGFIFVFFLLPLYGMAREIADGQYHYAFMYAIWPVVFLVGILFSGEGGDC